MPIAVTCPACQKRFSAPDAVAGKRARCSACGNVTFVPTATAQPAAQVTAQPAAQVTAQRAPQVAAQPAGQATAQPAPQVVAVRPVAQPVAQAVILKPVTQAGSQVAVGQPVGQPRAQVVVGQPVEQPVRQVVVEQLVEQLVGQPAGHARQQVAVVRPVGQPRAPAPASQPATHPRSQPQSQPTGGNSLLDLLEHADGSGLPGPDVFGSPGGAFPPGRATLGRPYARKNLLTSPVVIGLGVVALIAVVGGGITAVVMLAPADDEIASAPRIAMSMPEYKMAPVASPSPAQPAAYNPPLAAPVQMGESESAIREAMALMRTLAELSVATVDRRTAEVNFPKLTENGQKLAAVIDRLQRIRRHGQFTAGDQQLMRDLEPETKRLGARMNSEKIRLHALAVQLKMEDHFARFNQSGAGT